MTVIADSKKRVIVPGAKPGDVFTCERQSENHFLLVRLSAPPPLLKAKKMTRAQIRRALKNSKLKFDMTWDQLREVTREP